MAVTGAMISMVTSLFALAAALIDGGGFRKFNRPEQDATEEYRQASRPLTVLLQTNPDIRFAYMRG